MKIENNYPKIKKDVNKFVLFRKIMLLVFSVSTIICAIVNLSVGGKVWAFYVIGGEVIFYMMFLQRDLIDNTFIKRFTIVAFIICGYLYMVDLIEKTNWSYFVINVLSFSIIIIQLLTFLAGINSQKKKFAPMLFTAFGTIIFCILAISKVVELNWPLIVTGSLALLVILVLFIFHKDLTIRECKKYFSIK